MPSVGTASLDLVVDKNEVGKNITGAVSGAGSSVVGAAKKIAGLVAGAFAVQQGITFFKGAIEEAREAAKVARQTEAVLTSTKGAAGLTSGEIGNLATKISNLAGIDDELVQTGENVLLTFTNIKNGAGKGNDIFNQATLAATNMSAALGTDLQGSIIQVGKALNDPIKGITALSRVGVSFTEQQKEQIKTLVASGKTMEAQKLILKELSTEFGGAAAAAADPAQKLSVVWGNFKESIGTVLLPILNVVAGFLAEKIPAAVAKVSSVVGPFIDKAKLAVNAFFAAFREGDVTSDGFIGKIERLGVVVRDVFENYVKPFGDWLENHLPIVLIAAGAAVALLISPILAVGVVYYGTLGLLYNRFEWFRDGVNAVIEFVVAKAQSLAAWFQQILPMIQEAIGHFVSIATAFWHRFGDDILAIASAIWGQIQTVINAALTIIQNVIKLVLAVINGDWSAAWDAIKGIVGAVFGAILGTIKNTFELIKGVFGGAFDAIKSVVMAGVRAIVDSFLGMAEWILKAAASAFGWVPGIGGKLKEASKAFEGFRDDVNAALGGIKDKNVNVTVHTRELKDSGDYATGGARAVGGPVAPYTEYVVGERGREILRMGDQGGHIIPDANISDLTPVTAQSTGGGPAVNIEEAHFHDEVDLDLLFSEAQFATQAGRF